MRTSGFEPRPALAGRDNAAASAAAAPQDFDRKLPHGVSVRQRAARGHMSYTELGRTANKQALVPRKADGSGH